MGSKLHSWIWFLLLSLEMDMNLCTTETLVRTGHRMILETIKILTVNGYSPACGLNLPITLGGILSIGRKKKLLVPVMKIQNEALHNRLFFNN